MRFRLFILLLILLFNTNLALSFDEEKCIEQAAKTCIDQGEREIEGFKVRKCWKYKQVFRCTSKEENNCEAFEGNRGCSEIKGECLKPSPTGLCNHLEKTFACGHKNIAENKETKIISSEFKVIRDEKDLSGCDPQIKDKYCQISEENCLEPGETRNINGKDVHKDCWKWDRKYVCRTDTKIDDCKELRDKGCIEKSRECIHQEEGRCDHYVVEYECENSKIDKVDCTASHFCIGDVCEEQERTSNNNFGVAASYLGVLAETQKDGESCGCNKEKDPDCKIQSVESDKCQLFKGQAYKCKRITGEYNCCSQKGFIKTLIGCSSSEKELNSKQQGNLCHFVGSWKTGLFKLTQKKSYCCFNSALARIIQVQGRAQLGIGWGNKKHPDCRALTLAEIQGIDFSKIDFSEVYEELKAKAQKDFGISSQDIVKKLQGYQKTETGMQNIMQDKMKRFYEKK